jgi:HK97 family phage prohead protease
MRKITSKQLYNLVKVTGKTPSNVLIQKDYTGVSASLEGRQVKFVFSSSAVDRDGDIILPTGIDTKNFMKNPVILWGHDASQLPVGKCTNIEVVGNELHGTVEIWPEDMPEIGPKCEAIYQILKKGVLGTSIGFLPIDYEFNEKGGILFNKIQLAETSIVTIPCNQDALPLEVGKEIQEEILETTIPVTTLELPKKDLSIIRKRQMQILGIF